MLSGDAGLELTNAGEVAAREIRKRYAGCYDVVVEFENHWKLKMADFASKWWKIEGKKQQAMRRGESVHGEDGTILKRRGGGGSSVMMLVTIKNSRVGRRKGWW